ncbi:MAG: aminopeptidase P family protein [Candidatus Eisenbacteria bacterium]|uniref:Aminopeptidase P family protein n=1 Tax=Eiseniibacteriota bacterium TaxID=2212470 RepID=A0A538T628_UNCEI|nr:MAG: aminopeptidase P family protein [Candidatus Eisenbacteria bacterium]
MRVSAETDVRSLGAQKLAQAQEFLRDSSLEAWLIAVRESQERPDPNLRFFLDQEFTWNSYFLITPNRAFALVATFDAPDLGQSGLFDEVRTYKEGARAALVELLGQVDPRSIGINVSQDDALADGLTAGLHDHLRETLAGTPYAARLQSAERFLALLRGVKLSGERTLIARAVTETEQMFDRVSREFCVGMTERQIAERFHGEADRAGCPTAWSRRHCPTVTAGAKSPVGHVRPGDEAIRKGSVIHVDFGIARDGYCSDLQRVWYAAADGEGVAPDAVLRAYAAIVESIELAAKALLPGVAGWEVDKKVRDHLASLGYPEYAHALGHHLGRAVHDGGGVLGPRWERYGKAPYETVREGSVYTLEPSIHLPDHGLVSLEEDVVVGPRGAEFLSRFPRKLPILTLR